MDPKIYNLLWNPCDVVILAKKGHPSQVHGDFGEINQRDQTQYKQVDQQETHAHWL
jgi:hypothetical protein